MLQHCLRYKIFLTFKLLEKRLWWPSEAKALETGAKIERYWLALFKYLLSFSDIILLRTLLRVIANE